MPTVSKKQEKFMQAVAHNPAFAKKVGVKQSVGKEFAAADKGKSFKRGGDMAKVKSAPGATPMGKVKTAAPSRDGIAEKGKTKGKMVVMAGSSKGMNKGGKC